MDNKIIEIVEQMTLEEKASLCSGKNFWETESIDRLNIPSVMLTDGPHGLRKQIGSADHLGLNTSVPAVCFPTASALAASWDKDLLYQLGEALGETCQSENVAVLLGPGINMKRSPLGGRNFEYFSEDPEHTGELAAAYINGVQSKGVGTSVKHFAVNNQEHERMTISAEIDERTLREIYLRAFEIVVEKSQPWTVMSAYNKINGSYCSEEYRLLTEILREEWNFEGLVVSDWAAVSDRVAALKAGLDLEMPTTGGYTDQLIIEAVKQNLLDEQVLNTTVVRILTLLFKAQRREKVINYDKDTQHQLAKKMASESIILLKNQDNILPLTKEVGEIAIIGEFAKNPRFQGGGSSQVNPTKIENVYDNMVKVYGKKTVSYSAGYDLEKEDIAPELVEDAVEKASTADIAVLFVGLPDRYESEGYDRQHMQMPQSHVILLKEVIKAQENIIVVLSNGSVVEMSDWEKDVKGIIQAGLLGQAGASAIVDIITGEVNPSGKLSETVPYKLSDNPSYLHFPGYKNKVCYREEIFIGYRYYDTKNIPVLYPFGYGLSYTSFEYSNLEVSNNNVKDTEAVNVSAKVKNTGRMTGKETVQLYVKDIESTVIRPEKELKAFAKLELAPGEEKMVSFTLDKRSFAYYDVDLNDWKIESGEFKLLIASSSMHIQLTRNICVESTAKIPVTFSRETMMKEWFADPEAAQLIMPLLEKMKESIGEDNEEEQGNSDMMEAIMANVPISRLITFSQGKITEEIIEQVVSQVNNKY